MTDLFSNDAGATEYRPLAERMRPRDLDHYIGQAHILAKGKPLRQAIENGQLHSMILWGPPGVGKTSLAKLIAEKAQVQFLTLSAVMSGVKEIRAAIDQAKLHRQQYQKNTLLFVDEVHRFNKAQQDAFLPYIEDGTLLFIGATTENPSFELNSALLSRARVYLLKSVSAEEIAELLERVETLAALSLRLEPQQRLLIAEAANGDVRRALNLLELAEDMSEQSPSGERVLGEGQLSELLGASVSRFDKQGDRYYDMISAFHKSVRGSSPDGALYWLCRMLEAGCDPLYLARRLVAIASEDIGNADPRAMQVALSAWDAFERVGPAEGERAIAQAAIYCACAAKSNAVYRAYNQCRADIRQQHDYEVPEHLRNAPTSLMSSLGYGADYRYAHDQPGAYAAGESYLPEQIHDLRWYQPQARGLEIKIGEKLRYLQSLDDASSDKRYQGKK